MQTEKQDLSMFPELHSVQALREELGLKAHLMKAEVMHKWEDLDTKWQLLVSNVKSLRDASVSAKNDVTAATQLLLQVVQEGYENISKSLSTSAH